MEWRASHILIKDRQLAEEILKRARKGTNFSTLAKEFSTCPSKAKGGDLGWFGPGKMVREFERLGFKSGDTVGIEIDSDEKPNVYRL